MKKNLVEYNFSKPFSIRDLGELNFALKPIKKTKSQSQRKQRKLIKVDRRLKEGTIFVIVEEENLSHPTYMI